MFFKIISKFFKKNKEIKSVFNFPKAKIGKFKFKKKECDNIWPTIFPTSCISTRRLNFFKFIKFLQSTKYPNLEIDARFAIFSKFINNEFFYIKKKLTIYNDDPEGITSNIKKFSRKWWLRRNQAIKYLEYILKFKKKKMEFSFDFFITKIISEILH